MSIVNSFFRNISTVKVQFVSLNDRSMCINFGYVNVRLDLLPGVASNRIAIDQITAVDGALLSSEKINTITEDLSSMGFKLNLFTLTLIIELSPAILLRFL